jgi:CHAT domain-containing protein
MNGKEIQNLVDGIREQVKLKNKAKCYDLLQTLIDEINENDDLSYLKKEELVKFINRAFLLFHDYSGDEAFFNRLLKKEDSKQEKNKKYIATLLNLFGELLYYMGLFSSAEKKYKESLAIRMVEFGERHPQTIECQSNLALLNVEKGDFRGAEKIYDSILSVYKKDREEYLEDYLYTLMNNGLLYWKWGKYAKAYEKYILSFMLAKEHDLKKISAEIQNNMGVLNLETGNYGEAVKYLSESLAIYKDALPQYHPFIVETLNNLAFALIHSGEIDKGEIIIDDLLTYFSDKKKQSRMMATVLLNASVLMIEKKEYENAETTINRILNRGELEFGKALRIKALINLSKVKLYQKMTTQTIELLDTLLEEESALYGQKHIQYAKTFSFKAITLFQLNKYEEAGEAIQQAVDIQNEILFDISTSFSRDYAWNFLSKIADDINIYLSFFVEMGGEITLSKEQVYETILKRKGIVFETNIERYRNILKDKNPLLRQQYDELIKLKEEVILRTTKGFFKDAKEENEKRIKALNEQISLIENKISAAIPSYKFEKEIRQVSLEMLHEKIGKEMLFVDFFKFKRFDFKHPQNKFAGESYIIFFIDNDGIQYDIIEDAQVIDRMIQKTDINRNQDNRGVSSPSDDEAVTNEQVLRQIYNLAFGCVEGEKLTDYSQLCVSTDGEFTKLPFETLLNNDGKYLIEALEIFYVSSGRSIIKTANRLPEEQNDTQHDVMLFANPEFYVQSEKKQSSNKGDSSQFRGTSTIFRNELDEFPPLPGTKEEVDAIQSLIDKKKIGTIKNFYKKDVNDSEIKKINSPLILHLATHGFYLDSRKDIHPFSRSGIALSGVNNMLRGEELDDFLEDGLLTATDSLSLKLMDTELVILSACRTGAGEVRNGEGVLGLSSAFLCAGASSVILSLWNVPDFFTVELMTTFYEGIFAGYTKSRSLREAKLKMIRKLRSEWGEAPTWIWGGFILFGNNDPLFS